MSQAKNQAFLGDPTTGGPSCGADIRDIGVDGAGPVERLCLCPSNMVMFVGFSGNFEKMKGHGALNSTLMARIPRMSKSIWYFKNLLWMPWPIGSSLLGRFTYQLSKL